VNSKGQFSIIAALLVAVVLIGTVITTYATLRYSTNQEQPQVLSAVDETNLALEKVLGFTVGYYGSVLQVTGDTAYAKSLTMDYLKKSLGNMADIKPEWGGSFSLSSLDLSANWFTNNSYSRGQAVVNYDLIGLGISGMSYDTSCRLDVQVSTLLSTGQVCLTVFKDGNEPVVNLDKQNFNFYRYSNLTWDYATPTGALTAFSNGTYLIDIPVGIDPLSYVVQVTDTRGILVAAASFSRITSTLMWNTTSQEVDYVDNSTVNIGAQSNFTAQQYGPDGIFDTLTEGTSGTVMQHYYPDNFNLIGSTTLDSGTTTALQSDNGQYMSFHSYASAYSGTSDFGYKTMGTSTSDFSSIRGSRFTCTSTGSANSITAYLSYTPPTATFGTTATGSLGETIMDTMRGQSFMTPSYPVVAQNIKAYIDVEPPTLGNTATGTSYQTASNYLRGSPFQASETGTVQSISAYLYVTSTYRHIKAAIYTASGTLVDSTLEVTGLSGGAQWVTFTFSGAQPNLTSGTTYILVIWADSGGSSVYLYYSSTSTNVGRFYSYNYRTSWPSPVSFNNDNRVYCIYCTYESSTNVKAAIYDNNGGIVASTDQLSIPASASADWQTFTFASPPTLAASTQYVLVVWSQSGDGSVDLRYASGTGTGRYDSQTYGSWPPSVTFSANSRNYCIYFTYQQTGGALAQAAIYSSDGYSRLGITEEKTLSATTGSWVTFNFVSSPVLTASTNYVLMVWSSDASNVDIFYNGGTAEYFRGSGTYPNWPSYIYDQYFQRAYSIYCTVGVPSEYTCEVEFTGLSNIQSWTQLDWATDSSCTATGVTITVQLYNYQADRYALNGEDGYNSAIIGTSDVMLTQTITSTPANFRDGDGNWKLKFKAVKATSSSFDLKVDLARFSPSGITYALDIEEQWTNVSYVDPRQDLCIRTGSLSLTETLAVDALVGSSWITVFESLQPNTWNNVSVAPYISSQNFVIRFRDSGSSSGSTPDSWNIDTVLLSSQPGVDALLATQDHTIVVELLQNGTMRWLGQNLQLETQGHPIPPIPVKAIHVNQTINGVNQEVPFQVEDWSSEYRIPVGLTNNATVFSNRQMIVFLINVNVSKVTVWWNGSDTATQTPLAYTNRYFNDNPATSTLNNGRLSIQFSSSGFSVTSTLGTTSSVATFMRINSASDNTDPELAFVIVNGVVRDIVQGEPEWSNGVTDCSNLYANTVYTLPANATYFTYQLRLMFVDSAGRTRTLRDLCPVKLSTSLGSVTVQTENGTSGASPIVASGTGTFKNYDSGSSWTAHHWSQFNSTTGAGAGIMFTNASNQLLYAFDSIASASIGSLNVSATAKTIEFSPVTQPLGTVSPFTTPNTYEITWHGAVVTFDGTANTTPIYKLQDSTPTGLWLLVEYQPKITVTSES